MSLSSPASKECCSTNNSGNNAQPNGPHSHHRSPRQPTAVVSLNSRQVERLRSVLDQEVQIHGRENFPMLEIPLHSLILNMRRKLREAGLLVKHVKMNGGCASFVFASSDSFPYSDIDLIFPLQLQCDQDFERVRDAVFAALLEMMPSSTNKQLITAETLRDVYIRKMVKVTDGEDRWSLFSLHNDYGRCIELKFVERMRRQFEFSVDSFQITLDPLVDQPDEARPTVRAESMYGDFMQALYHLNKRLIDTRNPEEIRGGGLLKYCHLLTRDYAATANCRDMEKYMCSRFFIDFPDINVQELKLLNYLQNHFGNEDELKLEYLQRLLCVIKESTICLMYHERRQTLAMVDRLRQQLSYNLMLYYPQRQIAYDASSNSSGGGGQFYSSGRHQRRHHHRHWQSNRYGNRNGGGQQLLSVSPVSTIASSSLEEEQNSAVSEENGAAKNGEAAPAAVSGQQQRHVPRQTLLYLPPNANHWIPVV